MSWPLVKLGEVAVFINGDRGKNYPSKGSFVKEGVPFISAGNLSGEELNRSSFNYISEERYNLLSNGKVKENDILFCLRGSLGKFAIVKGIERGAIASSLVIIRNNEKINLNFLKHYLGSPLCQREINQFENGAAQPNLSAKDLKSFKIPLPPLDEQKRIAAILDKADAIRRKRQQAIQLADDFLRSVFLDMFGDPVTWNKNDIAKGWTVKPIEEISLLKRGYDLPKQSRLEGNIPIYAANGITGTHNEFKVKGPGVITGRSGTIGKVIYSENDFWPLNTALYVTNFYGNNPKYIEWYLRFLNLERYVQGAGVPTLNRNLFLKEVSAVPPKAEQDRFEVICKLVSQLIFKNLDFNKKELFNSLSQKAFAGEL